MSIEILKIKAKELSVFFDRLDESGTFSGNLPIDKLRSVALTRNPIADSEDIGLVIAVKDNRCIGYAGVMPCLLKKGESILKINAHTTFYVDPIHRHHSSSAGKSVASAIIDEILASGIGLITTGLSDSALRYFEKKSPRFLPIQPLKYGMIHLSRLRPGACLGRKLIRYSRTNAAYSIALATKKFLSLTIDKMIWRVLTWMFISGDENTIRLIKVDKVRALSEKSIPPGSQTHFEMYRDHNIVNWMLEYPWVNSGSRHGQSNYYFSCSREAFCFQAYELEDDHGQYLGYFVVSLSSNEGVTVLKILDIALCETELLSIVVKFIITQIDTWGVDFIECSDECLGKFKLFKFLVPFIQVGSRSYFVSVPSNSIFSSPSDFHPNFCDCDRAFT